MPNGWNRIRFYTKTADADPFGNEKGTIISQYRRPTVTGVVPSPWVPGRIVLPEQFEDPFAEPAMQPMEKAYGRVSPGLDYFPEDDTALGRAARPGNRPGTRPGARPGTRPRPGSGPNVPPWHPPAVDLTPGGPPGGRPGVHNPRPARPGDREIKIKMDWGFAGALYGELTEFRDMMDCFAEASGMKPPKGPIGERARRIYDHMNASNPDGSPKNPIDAMKFAKCMALANAQDFAIGKLSNEAAKRLNRSPYVAKRPGGYRGGGWSTRMHNS